MARYKPTLTFAGSLEVETQEPLDARTVVPTKADLTVAGNFPYAYKGLPVYVEAEQMVYVLTDLDTTDIDNWKEVGSGEGNTVSVELTQAQYNALSDDEKNNGTVYFITDGQGGGGSSLPSGGTTGQLLAKKSNADDDVEWVDIEVPTIVGSDWGVAKTGGNTLAPNIGSVTINISDLNLSSASDYDVFIIPTSSNVDNDTALYVTKTDATKFTIGRYNSATLLSFRYVVLAKGYGGSTHNYTTTEKQIGTYLGKDLYEITYTDVTIPAYDASQTVRHGTVLLNTLGFDDSWTIVDWEGVAQMGTTAIMCPLPMSYVTKLEDNRSPKLDVRTIGIIKFATGWTLYNTDAQPYTCKGLTLRYVKEVL